MDDVEYTRKKTFERLMRAVHGEAFALVPEEEFGRLLGWGTEIGVTVLGAIIILLFPAYGFAAVAVTLCCRIWKYGPGWMKADDAALREELARTYLVPSWKVSDVAGLCQSVGLARFTWERHRRSPIVRLSDSALEGPLLWPAYVRGLLR